MNISLILLGLCMSTGSLLIYQQLRRSRTGFSLMAAAGVGVMLVGCFPEDTIYWAHLLGADLAFLLGNIALIVIGVGLRLPRWLRWYSAGSGVIALGALVLFLTHNRFFLGLGGMERVVAYPQTIWLVVFGLHVLSRSNRSAIKHGRLAGEAIEVASIAAELGDLQAVAADGRPPPRRRPRLRKARAYPRSTT